MLHKSIFFLVFFLALFGGGIVSLGAPSYFSYFIDILVVTFFIFSLFARATKGLPIPHLWQIIFCFLGISLFSIYVNDYPATRSIFSLRLLFRFYFFYVAIILMRPDDNFIKSLNWFLGFLLIIQFPVVTVNAPVSFLIGIGKGTFGNVRLNAHMMKLALHGAQT